MKILNKYINPKIILNILLGIAIVGMFLVLFAVNRINCHLNADLGFEKDTIYTLKTKDSNVILPDTLVFSSRLPGFNTNQSIDIKSEYKKRYSKVNLQYISDRYFDFFNYEKLAENKDYFLDHSSTKLVYLNDYAVKELGFNSIDDAVGRKLMIKQHGEILVCGVVKEIQNLNLCSGNQSIIYQLSTEHLTYAFFNKNDIGSKLLNSVNFISFQQRVQNQYKLWEDIIYSTFLFVNIIILLICLGYIGNKFALKKERELYKLLGIGIHIFTLVVSKTYIYLIVIVGLVAGPLALLLQKLWLGIYANRVSFGLIDLFLLLSVSLLTIYLVCCPKKKLEKQIKGKAIQLKSI